MMDFVTVRYKTKPRTCELFITWFASRDIGNGTPNSDWKLFIGDRVPLVSIILLTSSNSEKA